MGLLSGGVAVYDRGHIQKLRTDRTPDWWDRPLDFEDAKGAVWFGTSAGVSRIQNGHEILQRCVVLRDRSRVFVLNAADACGRTEPDGAFGVFENREDVSR